MSQRSVEEIKDAFLDAAGGYGEEVIPVELSVGAAISLVATLQLACRHPQFNGATREFAEGFARTLQARMGLLHPDLAAGLELGWNPALDTSARRCRVCGCTDERACPGGCHWITPDLCSECAPAVRGIIVPGR